MATARIILLEDDPITPVPQELLLTDENFPANYVNKQHLEDYKITSAPIEKELIFHEHRGGHPRLLLRCSVRLTETLFCAMTFVLDTGAPKIYLSEPAKSILTEYNIQNKEKDLGVEFIQLLGHKYRTEVTPEGHAPANILGLRALCRLGLTLFDEPNFGFFFTKNFDYLHA